VRQGPLDGRRVARPVDAIAREVFEREPPLNVPYEFLNIGGKKMSTSKGRARGPHDRRGHPARAAPLPVPATAPQPGDRVRPRRDRCGAAAVRDFDKFAAATAGREVKGELPPGYEATFRYSLVDPNVDAVEEAALFRPAFAHLALLVQIPGSMFVPGRDRKGQRADGAGDGDPAGTHRGREAWLATYAPDSAKVAIQPELPRAAWR
jgi:lysyl-tRNA synthetase class I